MIETSSSKKTALAWLTITFVLALGSVLYELVLAQTLASVMGNTTYRYNLTIGLYIASMGIGAALVDKFSSLHEKEYFVKVEICLAILGAMAPWIVLIHDSGLQYLSSQEIIDYFSTPVQYWSGFFNNALIIVVGILSGIELPLLMRIGKNMNVDSSYTVLSLDYLGTMMGAAIFPLFLFPNFNLFTISYLVSLVNILIAYRLAVKFNLSSKIKTLILAWTITVIGLILTSKYLNVLIVSWFYDKG